MIIAIELLSLIGAAIAVFGMVTEIEEDLKSEEEFWEPFFLEDAAMKTASIAQPEFSLSHAVALPHTASA